MSSTELEVMGGDTQVAVIASESIGVITKSEVEAQLDAAHKYPRSIKRFLDDAITLATFDKEVAMSCIYALPRGGKVISGPSVRLAEICASAYGNLHMGARVVGIEEVEIVAQGVTWDLEKNNRVTIEVRRRITNSKGNRYNEDMITVTGNAAASIGLRNSIFRVIPRAYVNAVYQKAREVSVGNAFTLSETRAKVIERLAKTGVLVERILARTGRPSVQDITLDDVELLIGLGTAIKNGDVPIDEAFPPKVDLTPGQAPKSAIDRIVEEKNQKKPETETKAVVETKPSDNPPSVAERAPEPDPGENEITDDQYTLITDALNETNLKLGDVQKFMKTIGCTNKGLVKNLRQKDYESVLQFIRSGGKQ